MKESVLYTKLNLSFYLLRDHRSINGATEKEEASHLKRQGGIERIHLAVRDGNFQPRKSTFFLHSSSLFFSAVNEMYSFMVCGRIQEIVVYVLDEFSFIVGKHLFSASPRVSCLIVFS